jgi:transposase
MVQRYARLPKKRVFVNAIIGLAAKNRCRGKLQSKMATLPDIARELHGRQAARVRFAGVQAQARARSISNSDSVPEEVGSRAGIRSILFLIAGIARRFDPTLAAFHQKLTKAGKPKMVVRIALARKLLVRLNAKARDARIACANAT